MCVYLYASGSGVNQSPSTLTHRVLAHCMNFTMHGPSASIDQSAYAHQRRRSPGIHVRVRYMKGKVMASGERSSDTWQARNTARRTRRARLKTPSRRPGSGFPQRSVSTVTAVLTHKTRAAAAAAGTRHSV